MMGRRATLQSRSSRESLAFTALITLLLGLALAVGGASRENALPLLFLNLAGFLSLPFALWRLFGSPLPSATKWGLLLLALTVSVPIVQLIPLPPSIWIHVPGATIRAEVFEAAGIGLPWAPISLTPDLTVGLGLALILPSVIFIGAAALPRGHLNAPLFAAFVVLVLGLGLGMLQIAGGSTSPAYLYAQTNRDSLVGLFSNRNHEAALLVCAIPFACAYMGRLGRMELNLRKPVLILALLAIGILIMGALASVRSRAGVFLFCPALIGGAAIFARAALQPSRARARVIILAVIAAAALALALFVLSGSLARISNYGPEIRFLVAPVIWQSAMDHFPLGSGIGSFDAIYRSVEPIETVTWEFFNHAHNDYLEIFHEAGAPAAFLLLGFVVWWLWMSINAWRRKQDEFAQASSLTIGILLIHSAVDYPLRTVALACLFAFCAGILAASLPCPRKHNRPPPRP